MAGESYVRLREAYALLQSTRGPVGWMNEKGLLADKELPARIDAYLNHAAESATDRAEVTDG